MTFKEMIRVLSSQAAGMRILYVEDEPLIRTNTALLLESIFTEVITASNGREGLRFFEEKEFDIVITDILMPEMNGVAMIRAMKEIRPTQVFIVTSACEESSYLLELINLRVAQFLLKPIQSEQIVAVLHEAVKNIYNERKVHELILQLKQDFVHLEHYDNGRGEHAKNQ